jgi:CDP-diacylglycerol--glycerol-3-phosphate 3-phosphatidyltransferase
MVSYCRARAESLGFDSKVGIMQRPERIVFLGLGAIIHVVVLKLVIWLIAIFANFTALQRLRHAYKQDADNYEHRAEIKAEHLDKKKHAVFK